VTGPHDTTEVPSPAGPAGAGAPPEAEPAAGALPATDPEEELHRVSAERDEYLEALRRMKAEFDNYRRRVERERVVVAQAGVREVVADLLPVMDNLERAVEAIAAHQGGPEAQGIVAGVEMVRQQLAGLLTGRGVEEIAAHEEAFDPQVHEAVYRTPSADHPEGTVVAVVERGYRLNESVLRPAKVVVSGGAPEGP
jgi:molecular chaperone GrpE